MPDGTVPCQAKNRAGNFGLCLCSSLLSFRILPLALPHAVPSTGPLELDLLVSYTIQQVRLTLRRCSAHTLSH